MNGPLKWHGGKAYLAKQIVELMPRRCANPGAPNPLDHGWLHYVEPYFGGGSVLLANEPDGISEVVNDFNSELTNFWNVLAKPDLFQKFLRAIEATPFSEELFIQSGDPTIQNESPTSRAFWFFVRCRQSLAGRMDSFAPRSRSRTRRGMNEQVSAWLNAIEGLPAVHERLKRVLILSRPALEVIRAEDGPRTLFYLDPPYLHETRTTIDEYGQHEMSRDDHHQLLCLLLDVKGRFLLSGYRSRLYDDFAKTANWRRLDFDLPNNAAGGAEKRRMTESVWMNY